MSNYNDIHVAGDLESVRLNPQLYIGQIENPLHLLEEVLDNSLDEIINNFASKININITSDGVIIIEDDGRGIPTNKKNGIPIPILVCSKLHTSAKIIKTDVYKVSSGLHGIGLVAVAALSEYINIKVFRNKKMFLYKGLFDTKNNKLDWETKEENIDTDKTGTIIEFKPDKNIFETIEIPIDKVINRCKIISLLNNDKKFDLNLYKDSELVFTNSEIDSESFKLTIKSLFVNSNNNSQIYDFKLEDSKKENSMHIYFFYDYSYVETQQFSLINSLEVHRGDHFKWIKENIKNFLWRKFKRDKRLSGIKPEETDFLLGLRLFVISYFKDAKYSSQTKDELKISQSVFDKLFKNQMVSYLENIINQDESLVVNLLSRILKYRLQLNIKKIQTNKTNKKRNTKLDISSNLVDCENSKDSTLFIVEGESAGGTIVQCRDTKKHAIYKLRGKALVNVETAPLEKTLTNEVCKDLLSVLNLYKVHKSGKMEKLDGLQSKYSKIVILTDADIDGKHIVTLLIRFFKMFASELIENERIFICLTPLYGTYKDKKFIPIWDDKELEKYRGENLSISRHKGLGEFSPEELETIIFNEDKYVCLTYFLEQGDDTNEI